MTDEKLLDLYEKSTHEIPGTETIRAIDFRMFKAVAEIILHDGYTEGVNKGMDTMDKAIKNAFNLIAI